ncbi:TldD/PmbA family protein [Thermococcus sp.]
MMDELARILNHKNVEWEIYWEIGTGSSFKIEKYEIVRAQQKFHSGIGLRIGYRGRTGFSYITGVSHRREELERFVERTIKLARVSEVPFRGFPDSKKKNNVPGLYDRATAEMSFEEGYDAATMMIEKGREILGEEHTFSGGIAFGTAEDGVMNSNGIEKTMKSTGISMGVYVLKKNGRRGSGSYYRSFRRLSEAEGEMKRGIEEARRDAELSWSAGKISQYEGELVLEPHAVSSAVSILMHSLYGDSVYHGQSRFQKIGERISSEILTLVDDSTIEGGARSYPFDGEGNPGRRSVLIEKGVLRGFLLDETYGRLMGMESTANAARDFRTMPHIAASNVIVDGKRENLEEYEGIVIKKVFGEHTANPISGDFSLTVELGYRIENGELIPFKDNMFVGNIFEMLNSIAALGRKDEDLSGFISPRMLIYGKIV